ncbi:RING finger protein 212B-like [Nasonia vitripennis]|uniref:RING-type domain-containing protein n=1 Tax=Nasonia vitripennis TaxID=7425 RepID=A0A7M7M2J9_NASVI|nr:RING finger protein 212B-like [Nasonia vitripennis]
MIIMEPALDKAVKNYKEWVRCNSCWSKIEQKEPTNFYITQCGHVYCGRCIVQAEKRCFQCGDINVISLPVREPLSPQIAHYFSDVDVLRDKAEQADIFQKNQIKLYLQRAHEVENKYQALKQEYMANADHMKKLHEKYNKLKMITLMMQKENKKLLSKSGVYTPTQYRTPPDQVNLNSSYKNDEGFRVPTITKVPKSAGYYSASSSGSNFSNYQTITPKSNYSRYSK